MKPSPPIASPTPSVACIITTRTMQRPFAVSTQATRPSPSPSVSLTVSACLIVRCPVCLGPGRLLRSEAFAPEPSGVPQTQAHRSSRLGGDPEPDKATGGWLRFWRRARRAARASRQGFVNHACQSMLPKRGNHCSAEQHAQLDRKSTRLNSSHSQISYAVFCLKKKKKQTHIV